MEATYFFDPVCPFTWRTSRWLVAVAGTRDVQIQWRSFSLSILNGGNTPDQYKPMMDASTKALRLVEALRAAGRNDAVGAFYTEIGNRTHEAGAALTSDVVVAAAAAAGVDDLSSAFDDESWDAAVKESHEYAFHSAGPDIGSPVLWVTGAPRGVHGPIIGTAETPPLEESLAIWDAVVPLSQSSHFFELKRGRS